eukprot:1048219-Pelagomonas_calceolata.AAC.2
MPELPAARRARYLSLGLPLQDVLVLADEPTIATFFDTVLVCWRWPPQPGLVYWRCARGGRLSLDLSIGGVLEVCWRWQASRPPL